MIKRFIIALVLLILVGGGIVGFNLFREKAIADFFANMPRPALTVSTIDVAPVTWTPGIEAIGTVSASQGVDLTVETTGVVKAVMFKANDKVAAGQVLLQLDDAVQRADLESARTQAALDKQALERAQALLKRGAGNAVTVDNASAAASTSASQVAKLQAVLDQKQLVAPFGGTMGIPKVDPGQYLAPGTIVATLQDVDTMRVDFSVPEQDLTLLKFDQPVRLGVDDASMDFKGTVTGIEPKVDPTSRLVLVRATVTNPDGKLSPGQFVQVRVELPVEKEVIAVPQTAVVNSLYGDYAYVVRPADPKPAEQAPEAKADAAATAAAPAADAAATPEAEKPALVANQVFVKVGRRSEGLVEVTSGIKAGDVIVTAGQNRLSNGSSVNIDNTVTPDLTAAK